MTELIKIFTNGFLFLKEKLKGFFFVMKSSAAIESVITIM